MPRPFPTSRRARVAVAFACVALFGVGAAWLQRDPGAPATLTSAPAASAPTTSVTDASDPLPGHLPETIRAAAVPSDFPAQPPSPPEARSPSARATDADPAPSSMWRIAQGPPSETWIGRERVLGVPLHL